VAKDTKYDYYTISHARQGDGFTVYGWGTYPRSSVLAGQPMKVYIQSFPTFELAQQAYPGAQMSSKWTEPQVSLSHLPGEDDPVPGGMYPDDI
jgi:hypothetical protein